MSDIGQPKAVEYSTTCWHRVYDEAGVDNSFTSFKDTGATITAIFDDGCPDATFSIPDGTGGWTAQIDAISAGIQSILPDSLQNSAYCTIPGTDPPEPCAGLPTPAIFLPDMKWRYAGFRICPGDKAPVKFIYNSDQRENIVLDYNNKRTRVEYFDRCVNVRTKEVEWIECATGLPYTGELVDGKPLCASPCTVAFPALPNVPLCNSGVLTGCVFDADGVQQVGGVTELYKYCDGDDQPQIQLLTNYGQASQDEVKLQEGWYFGDCATGNPVEPPQPTDECIPIGVHTHCVMLAGGESVQRKTGTSVSDFDPGDLNIGDPASCTFSVNVDDPNPAVVMTPIAGYTFVDNGGGNWSANFTYDGTSNPNQPLTATITLETGEQAVVSGGDFTLCSGGGQTELLAYTMMAEKTTIKEICYEGKPSKWQDVEGNYVEYSSLIFCEDPEPGPHDDFEIVELFSMSNVSGALRNREWDIGPRPSSFITTAQGAAIRESFDFSQPTTVDGPWTSLSVNDSNADSQVQDIQVIEGVLIVDTPMRIRWGSTTFGYFAFEIGYCCGELELAAEGAMPDGTANPTPEVFLPKGVHQIRMWNIDDYSASDRNFRYSLDGGVTWIADNTPPGIEFSAGKPNEACKKVKVCKPGGQLIGLLDGVEIDPSTCYECSKFCTPTSSGGTEETPIVEKEFEE